MNTLTTLTGLAFAVSTAALLTKNRQLRAERDQARDAARRDPLTGALNRDGLADLWPTLPTGQTVALVDLDQFKHINDTHGHDAGDRVLTTVCANLRRYGTVTRLGGDEFLLIGEPDATSWPVRLPNGRTIRATASIGTATSTHDMRATLAAADAAMYRAKNTGGDTVAAHHPHRDDRPAIEDRPQKRLRDSRQPLPALLRQPN